jgi:NADP-reducing hydrogenase subunit HndD
METIKLTIDNRAVEVPQSTSVYQAAKSLGIDIPTLCYMNLHDLSIENKPAGCRICVVEVEGRRNLAPSCSTTCANGMVVKTHTTRVINARRTVMELILSDHPKDCLTCPKSGRCELQDMSIRLGQLTKKISHHQSFVMSISASCVVAVKPCVTISKRLEH